MYGAGADEWDEWARALLVIAWLPSVQSGDVVVESETHTSPNLEGPLCTKDHDGSISTTRDKAGNTHALLESAATANWQPSPHTLFRMFFDTKWWQIIRLEKVELGTNGR